MIVVVLSPFIYLTVKYIKFYSVIALCILYITGIWVELPGFSVTSVFFFLLGAYFSISGIDFVKLSEKCLPYLVLTFILTTLVLITNKDAVYFCYLRRFNNITGAFLFVGMSSYFINKGKWNTNAFLLSSSFFIYAYHGIFSERALRFFFLIMKPTSETIFLLIYFSTAIILILGGIFSFYILKRLFPLFTSIITGRR